MTSSIQWLGGRDPELGVSIFPRYSLLNGLELLGLSQPCNTLESSLPAGMRKISEMEARNVFRLNVGKNCDLVSAGPNLNPEPTC